MGLRRPHGLVAVLLACLLAVAAADGGSAIEEDEGVLVLTDANFQDALDMYGPLLVEFYAPWCGHCKNLAPIYVETAERLAKENPPVRIAKLDATEHRDSSGKFEVRGFPTMKLVRSLDAPETAKEFSGPRGAEPIAQWVLDNIGSRAVPSATAEDVTSVVEANRVVLAGAFSDESAGLQTYREVATGMSKVFSTFAPPDAFSAYGTFTEGSVFVLKTVDGETSVHPYTGDVASRRALHDFVAQYVDKYDPEQGVLVLTEENFDDAIAEYGTLLVEFYAPWCGHCKHLAPEYAKAAQQLAADGAGLAIAKVDATEHVDVKKSFDVSGYPTLAFVCGSRASYTKYSGPRTAEGITSFVREKSFASVTPLADTDSLNDFVAANEVAVVAAFTADDADAALAFRKATACIPGIAVAATSDPDVAASMGIPMPGVSVFKQFRKQRSDYDGSQADDSGAAPFSREAMSAWVARESTKFPEEDGVLVLGADSLDDAMAEYGTLLLEFYAPWCGHCKALKPEYAQAAGRLMASDPPIRIAKIDATEHGDLAAEFGVKGYPTLKLHRHLQSPEEAVSYSGARTADALEKWMLKKIGSVPTLISGADALTAFIGANSNIAFGFFSDVDGEAATAFRRATTGLIRMASGYTDDTALFEQLEARDGDIVVLKTGEGGAIREQYSGDNTDAAAIKEFVSSFIDPIAIEAGVLVVDEDNYDLATSTYPTLLLEFYAPWCGHCKNLAPKYAEAAAELRDGSPSYRIAKVDATDAPALAKTFEVRSYPTIKFLCRGKIQEYTGQRTAESIAEWVREHSAADVTVVNSVAEADALTSSSVVTLFAYVGGEDDVDAHKFRSAVACSEGFALGITTDAAVAAKYGVESAPAMWAVNSYRKAPLVFQGDLSDADAVDRFIDAGTKKFAEDQGVLVLDEENFEDAVSEYGSVLVEFYAPWCGHCKKLAPEYAKAAQELLTEDNPLRIAKVDATVSPDLAAKYGVKGYPTLKLVRANGDVLDFNGGRTADGVVTWLRNNIGSRPTLLADSDAVGEVMSSAYTVALGFFADASSAAAEAFRRGATGLKGVAAGYTVNPAAFAKFGVDGTDTVVVFKTTDGGPERHTYDGDLASATAVNEWLKGKLDKYISDGGVLALDTDNFDDAVEEFGSLLVEFYAPWCGHCKALAPKYAEAAMELMANDPPLRIAKVDATAEPTIASRFDIGGYPTLNFVCGGRVVKYDGERETAAIVEFVKANSFKKAQELASRADLKALKGIDAYAVAGFESLDTPVARTFLKNMACSPEHVFVTTDKGLRTYLGIRGDAGMAVVQNFKAKPSVAKFRGDVTDMQAVEDFIDASARKFPEDESVLVLDDGNFDDAVSEYGSVLVEFYAPWCGHCKKLAPEYAKAAQELKGEGIRIAKVDATANRALMSRFEVTGFPTLKLVRANGDKPLEFGGQRTASGVTDWMRKKIGSRPSQLTTAEAVQGLLSADQPVIVAGYFESGKGADLKAFKAATAGLPRLAAGYIVGDESLAALLAAKAGDVIVMKTTEEAAVRDVFDGDASNAAAVRDFVTSYVDKYAYDDGVLVLEDDVFADAVREWGSMLVEFYAPWCGHCKQLAPKYAEAAKILKQFDPSLAIAKMDATEHKVTSKDFDVTSFPTLKFVCGNVRREFSGARETADIVDFVKQNSYADAAPLGDSVDDAEAFATSADVVAIAFVEDADGADARAFRKATACSHEVKKGVSTSSALASKFGIAAPGIVLFRNFREGKKGDYRVYTGSFTDLPAVATFVFTESRRFAEEDNVIVLDESNFDVAVEQYGSMLVEFYAPWCGHCKKLAPEYSKAAAQLSSEVPPFYLGKVDATANPSLAARYGVKGYPTLKLVTAYGDAADATTFNGKRTSTGIVEWVQKLAGSQAQLVNNAAEAQAVKDAGYLVAFGAFADVTSQAAHAFKSASAGHKHYVVGYTSDAGAMETIGASPDSIVVFDGDSTHEYSGDVEDIQAIGAFLVGFLRPLMEDTGVLVLDDTNFDDAVSKYGPLLVKFHAPWCKACKQMKTQYQEAGEQLAADGLRVAQVDADAYETYKSRYGVEEYPTLRLMCGGMSPEFTGDEMNTTQIVDWVRETALAEPPVLVNAALQVAEADARVAVIGFFSDTDSHEAEAFRRATACMSTVTRLMSTDPKAADHYGVKAPAVLLIKRWGTKRDEYSGGFGTTSTITSFVLDNAFEFPEEDDVLVLDDSNFDRAVNRFGYLLVEFYAPWCGHCKKLAPEYAKAATELRNGKPAHRIAKVDATAAPKVKSRFEIAGFPTLKMVRTDDKSVDFSGARTADGITSFVRDNAPKGFKLFVLKSKGEARQKLHDEL